MANALESLFASHAHDYPAELLELLQNEAPLFLECSVVLDRMHGVAVLGLTVMCKYKDFVEKLVERTLTCATGGPTLSDYECGQCAPFSTSDSCLTSGVCVGVSQICHRPKYSIDGHKDATCTECLYRVPASLLSVVHMAVSALVAFLPGSVGMAFVVRFKPFPMLRVGKRSFHFCCFSGSHIN